MKYLPPITLLTLCLSSLLEAEDIIDAAIEENSEIKFGIETVSGYRSGYNYRGFELSEDTLDFQIESEIALDNNLFLNIGAWYATETGDGDFDESAFFANLRYTQTESLTLGVSATYRAIDQGDTILSASIDNGVELGFFASFQLNDNLATTAGVYYDTGADGFYNNLELNYSNPVSDKAFYSLKSGVSAVANYYGRDGLNDFYARASITYNISDTVSVSPFVGTSLLLDSDDEGDSTTYGGIWFEVSF